VVTESTGFDRVEFVVDEGLPGEASFTDFVAPYEAQFGSLPSGDHTVRAYLLDSGGARLSATDPDAVAELPRVGSGGIHLVGVGDSITYGVDDHIVIDNTSADCRHWASRDGSL